MKIFYVAPMGSHFPSRSANSIHIMNICSSIKSLDHDLTLVCALSQSSVDQVFEHYGQERNFQIQRLPVWRVKGFSLIYSFFAALITRKSSPELVVSRDAVASFFLTLLGLNVVLDSHGPLWRGSIYERWTYRFLRKSHKLKKMTFNSHALFEMYKQAGQLPVMARTEVAHNGANPFSLEEKIETWPGRSKHIQVGYLGHLYKGRGVDIVLACAEALSDFDFHIIGGDDADIEFWKSETSLSNIYFHGYVSPGQVYRYRNTCDILLAPYQSQGVMSGGGGEDSSKYMNPIKLIEYLSSCKVVVASDLLPIREIIDESCGVLVSPSDKEEWVLALLSLRDDHKRQELAAAGYKKFQQNLTWDARARKILE